METSDSPASQPSPMSTMSMSTATQRRPQTSAPTDGSHTITARDAQQDDCHGPSAEPDMTVGVLKLRGVQRRMRQRVAWDANVVDNEGCGKKKSKICCIYHKPRRFDESSSESDSAPASDSDSDGGGRCYDNNRAHPARRCRHASTVRREGQGGSVHELHHLDLDSDVNAYEKPPKRKSQDERGHTNLGVDV